MRLLPRLIAGRMSRSFVASGYLHALYLERCDSRLRQPLTDAVGHTMFCYFPSRRKHPAGVGCSRPRRAGSPLPAWASGEASASTTVLLVEIADDGTEHSRELFGEEREYYQRLAEEYGREAGKEAV